MEGKQVPNIGAHNGDGRRLVGDGTALERDVRGAPEAEAGLRVPASDAQSRLSVHRVFAGIVLRHLFAVVLLTAVGVALSLLTFRAVQPTLAALIPSHRGILSIGLLLMFGVSAAFLASLTVLPSILLLLSARRRNAAEVLSVQHEPPDVVDLVIADPAHYRGQAPAA